VRTRLPVFALVALNACASAPAAPPGRDLARLAATIDSIIETPPLHYTQWGIAAMDAVTGRMLYAHDAEKHFIPASNVKLPTTIAALGALGPDFRYTTDVLADASGDSATLLVVRASGDPTLSARFDTTDFAPLDSLARAVAASGIRLVRGDLVIDASRFDDQRVHGTWEIGDLPFGYAAPPGAFVVAEGTFQLVREPGIRVGAPAIVRVIGGDGLQPIVANVITDTARASTRWSFEILDRRDTVRINGRLGLGEDPDTLRYAVTDPDAFAARAFHAALRHTGVSVQGGVRIVRDSAQAASLGAHRVVASRTSPPLAEIVAAILKPSQNWMAEQLLRTLGAQLGERGSWGEGIGVERRYLVDHVGIDSLAFTLRDGSGLSVQNLLSPVAIVQMLAHARNARWGDAFRAALPAPGERGGTLSSRLRGLEERVAAKTGSITNVNSLSGYVVSESGRDIIFSIMTNASGVSSASVRNAIDAIVRVIAREGGP
jgi:D-alanyl-D-alanine carboxypeptidase/D-alanyl-D-alanine-endopeptidase (penicillin-binding protein 4)